jgi:hypothetical protein
MLLLSTALLCCAAGTHVVPTALRCVSAFVMCFVITILNLMNFDTSGTMVMLMIIFLM